MYFSMKLAYFLRKKIRDSVFPGLIKWVNILIMQNKEYSWILPLFLEVTAQTLQNKKHWIETHIWTSQTISLHLYSSS